jgi:hypothetical protein
MPSPKNVRGTPINRILQQINQVIGGLKHQIIEGIEIDFRHPKFDSENLEAPRGLFIVRDLDGGGPNLSFPWPERAEKGVNELASSTRTADSFPETIHDYVLESGDRLYIGKIDTVSTNNPLLRGCNPDRVEVYINIQKVKAGLIEIQHPIVMRPRNEIWEHDFRSNYFSAIAGRISDYFGTVSIEGVPDDGSFAYLALRKLLVINRISAVTEATINGQKVDVVLPNVPDQEYHDNSSIWFTINDAVNIGYLWAKSEDERKLLSKVAKKITDKQAEAGGKSGQSRLKEREHKLKIAKAISDQFLAQRDTSPLQVEIIDYVDNLDRWKACGKELGLVKIHKPRRSGIEGLVSELFGSQSRSAPKSRE